MKTLFVISAGWLSVIFYPFGSPPLSNHNATFHGVGSKKEANTDSLPRVLSRGHADLIATNLRHQAIVKFATHRLPVSTEAWKKERQRIKEEIIKKAGIVIDHKLPLHYEETGVTRMKGFTVKNITFQTRPGVYATANLFVPDGKGPFPAIVNMHGHWPKGRVHEVPQARGPSLALNGYVCLSVDAFGSGERTTAHGTDEYHGANLGASLMNIGESLLGFQVSDNMRAVDLLASLPYVDANNIGATGASGGGNQTMWLSAIDERIKACMPVVSVGTFESAVMRSNCICELLIDGLTFTEASGVLALIAPRAIKMCNHEQDANPTFYPAEMKRTYENARPVFRMLGAEKNITYELFNLTHGYWPEDREAMLGWFDLHLKQKGSGERKKETAFDILDDKQLMVYPTGKRDPKVQTIAEYCKRKGTELRRDYLQTKRFDVDKKKAELKKILRINDASRIESVHRYGNLNGWDRIVIRTSDDKILPLLHKSPRNASGEYVVMCDPSGKQDVPSAVIEEAAQKGAGVVLIDLSGTGEASSSSAAGHDELSPLHTQSRAELWLGKTVLGEWTQELKLITAFLTDEYSARKITLDGRKEAGLASLFLAALEDNVDDVILRSTPASYLFDNREGLNFFSMGVHIPDFLEWGDVSLAAALSGTDVLLMDPVTMSGDAIGQEDLQTFTKEFERIRKACGQPGKTLLVNDVASQ